MILVAALFLTGVTPSFAEKNSEAKPKPSAEINWDDAPTVEGTSALLMDAGSGEILYEKNAYEKRDVASLTKIMTCLVVLETLELSKKIIVDIDVSNPGSGIDIVEGETFTVEQLLYAMMLPSANDAALVLANEAGGSIENFCDMMNARALRCGAENTNFTNPTGLNEPIQPNHRTTAYDMAIITKEAMENKTFRKIVSTTEYTIPKTNKSKARKLANGNKCLTQYDGNLGVKVGYTSTAGNCYCGWAKREETNLIAVVLNSSSYETKFEDAVNLWDYGFSKYFTYPIASANEVVGEFKVKHGNKGKVSVAVEDNLGVTLNKDDDSKGIKTKITPDNKRSEAPIKKGDELGTITVYKDNEIVKIAPLYAAENIEKGGVLSYLGIPDQNIPLFFATIIAVAVLLFVLHNMRRKYQYKQKRRKRAQLNRDVRRREWEKEKNPFD